GVAIGEGIRGEIREHEGLTASVGVAPNKFLAKIASDLEKPDGFVVVRPEEVEAFLRNLPVARLWGVGEQLHRRGRGIDDRPVVPEAMAKSMGAETTFAVDCEDPGRIRQSLLRLAERVSARARREGLAGSTITVKIRFADFTTLTRALTLPAAVTLTDEIYHPALSLVHKVPLEGRKAPILGIAVSKLTPKACPGQMPLFPSDPRRENAARAVDEIRRRFGEAGIVRLSLLPSGSREA